MIRQIKSESRQRYYAPLQGYSNSLRLPVAMIEDRKVLANRRNVPYQSLPKVFLAERLERERRRA